MSDVQIIMAESAGFCFGVKRAVDTVYQEITRCAEEGRGPLYTYGPIIHNEQVVSYFEKQGVKVIKSVNELRSVRKGTVIIRSHGVSKEICTILDQNGLHTVDATCPFVKKIHRIVEKESSNGKRIIIIGNNSHPEVEGIRGWCGGDVTVIETQEEAESLRIPEDREICIVSQTTFNSNKFKDLVEIIRKKRYDMIVFKTSIS